MIIDFIIEQSFTISLVAACLYLWACGQNDEKFAIVFIATSYLMTKFSLFYFEQSTAIGIVWVIDIALLLSMFWIALKSDKYWPIWFCGFHLITVASHFSSLVAASETLTIVFNFSQFWSIPAIGAAVIGTYLDRSSHGHRELS